MAAAIYARLEATARRLIKAYGYGTQLERDGAVIGPPHNPQQGPPTRHSCRVVETEYSLTNRDATLLLTGDKLGLISTELEVTPTKDDRILLGGVLYRFVDLQPLSPGGQVLLFEFHCRK